MKSEPILTYQDYRLYLADFVRHKKNSHSQWSLGSWHRQLGLKSRSTLSMILNGKRHPGTKLVKTFCHYFRFSEREARHFHKLVQLQKGLQQQQKLTLLLTKEPDHIKPISPVKNVSTNAEALQDLLMSSLTHVLRELTTVEGFKYDLAWIQKTIHQEYSQRTIEKQIRDLISHELLELSEGTLKAGVNSLKIAKPSKKKVAHFHEKILAQTQQALVETPEEERAFHLSYLNVRKENLAIAKKMLREFQAEFNKLTEDKPGDSVYQLSMQFVPVASTNQKCSQNL